MILLDKKGYKKVIAPLRQVAINSLFARSVVEQKVTGKIFVDNVDNPQTFYVVHPYGMSLLFGDNSNELFNASFKEYALNIDKTRNKHEWMQAFPNNWDNVLSELFKPFLIKSSDNTNKIENGIVELNTRVNFKFNITKYLNSPKNTLGPGIIIVKADRHMFHDMKGSVVPFYFWDSEDDFLKNGLAYAVFYKRELASMSFSSYRFGNEFELGIETKEKFRGRGFAELACGAIIDHCIANNSEPIWSCRLENIASYKLAQKLGFDPTLELPYYRLSN